MTKVYNKTYIGRDTTISGSAHEANILLLVKFKTH